MSEVTGAFVAPSAVVVGQIEMGEEASIWHGAVVRGDEEPIVIGARSNVQDNAVLHVSKGYPLTLGEGVTVGHGAIVHGCTIGANTLVGMGAIVMDGASVGRDCVIGAGALVTQGKEIPDRCLVVGNPGRVARRTTDKDRANNRRNAEIYVELSREALQSTATDNEEGTAASGPSQRKESDVQIRRARNTDIPGIAKLLLQVAQVHADGRPDLFMSGGTKYTDEELEAIIADDERPIFVAVDEDDQVLGYAFCVYEDYTQDTVRTHIRSLYIDDICVDEAARGRHVGRSVYDFVIAWAREQGFYNVTLNVWSCNPGAQRFYEAMGMRPYKVGMEQVL